MKFQKFIFIVIALLMVSTAFGQKIKDDWKYTGTTIYGGDIEIEVSNYFSKSRVKKNDGLVTFSIKEQPDKPSLFIQTVFAGLYSVEGEKYSDFSHLITVYEGNCEKRESRILYQEIRGRNGTEPIRTLEDEFEFTPVKPDSSGEKHLLNACKVK